MDSLLSTVQGQEQGQTGDLAFFPFRLQVAKLAAIVASDAVRKAFNNQEALSINTKSCASDLVTSLDLACDELITDTIKTLCPNDAIISEETYRSSDAVDLTSAWIIDPIDGTTNLAHGLPHFAISIAYVSHGVPEVGVISHPLLEDTYWAVAGQGAYKNQTQLKVSACQNMQQALLATGFANEPNRSLESNMPAFLHFMRESHGVRRTGSATLDLVYVACGYFDAIWELGISSWDVAAGMLLVQEAGGQVCGLQGQPVDLSKKPLDIVASNGEPSLHTALMQGLKVTLPSS